VFAQKTVTKIREDMATLYIKMKECQEQMVSRAKSAEARNLKILEDKASEITILFDEKIDKVCDEMSLNERRNL